MTKTDFNNLKEALAHAEDVRNLILCNQGLRKLPAALPELVNLETLDISANPLRQQLSQWLPNCMLVLTPLEVEGESEAAPVLPQPGEYLTRRDPSGAAAWPEFSSLAAWQALTPQQQASTAESLGRACGPGCQVLPPAGAFGLPRLFDSQTGLIFVVVAGGHFDMGLSEAEQQELKKLTRGWSAEARAHRRDLEVIARPLHRVELPAFLCSQSPILAAQAAAFMENIESAGQVCLFTPGVAAGFASQMAARLLSEAEWEYLARRGGGHSWLCLEGVAGRASLLAAAERALEKDLGAPESTAFGVGGLAWGSWVEDAWRPTYLGAPGDGSTRLPPPLPETLRGGALLSWPWQTDGEILLLHVTNRERRSSASFPLLLGRNLPFRP
jgi:formylglycine-generating enzyme required for sulfatase activity